MLKQLTCLSVEADGRYATTSELQFLKDYLQSAELRVSTYEKIRDAEEPMMDQAEDKLKKQDPNWNKRASKDLTAECRRDRKYILKCSAAAMLIDDLDRLRDGFLVWQRTIVRAVKDERPSQSTWQVMPEVLKQNLADDEVALMMPAIRLNQTLLS